MRIRGTVDGAVRGFADWPHRFDAWPAINLPACAGMNAAQYGSKRQDKLTMNFNKVYIPLLNALASLPKLKWPSFVKRVNKAGFSTKLREA